MKPRNACKRLRVSNGIKSKPPTVFVSSWTHYDSMAKRRAGRGENSARSTKRFLYVSKRLCCKLQDSLVSLKQLNLQKVNSNKTQNFTLTEATSQRQTMYSYSQISGCFWNKYNVAWPCQPEPSSDRTVPSAAVCIVFITGPQGNKKKYCSVSSMQESLGNTDYVTGSHPTPQFQFFFQECNA